MGEKNARFEQQRKEMQARVAGLIGGSGLSQEALAEAIGVHQTNISKIKSGERGLSVQQLVMLARYFRVSLDWLFTGEGQAERESGARPGPAEGSPATPAEAELLAEARALGIPEARRRLAHAPPSREEEFGLDVIREVGVENAVLWVIRGTRSQPVAAGRLARPGPEPDPGRETRDAISGG